MKNISAISLKGTGKLNLAIQKNRRHVRYHSSASPSYSTVVLFSQPPLKEMQASVIIPVKNESENITKTLDALRNQHDENSNPLSFSLYEILLLANNCSDNTYAVAAAYQQQHPQLQLHVVEIRLDKKKAHIGTARRLLMDEAFRRHQQNGHDGIILSTDGDTEVDRHWIVNTMHEMKDGCDAIGGRILTRQVDPDSRLYYLQDTTYRYLSARLEAVLDPTDNDSASCHFQCFGASLAVRCSAYQKAGRLPVIPFLEDEAFSRALYRVDARVRKSSTVKVFTSSRLDGRVKAGLSVHLKHLGKMKKENVAMYVESLPTLMQKYSIKRQLRDGWLQRKTGLPVSDCVGTIASLIHVSRRWLMAEMGICSYFGELWEKAEQKMYAGEWKRKQKAVMIEEAIGELRTFLKE